ncbi:MAG: hypothetical protein AB1592_18040 [Pseudomonadota bacterium]
MLAGMVAAASEAQEQCHIRGEALAAMKYARSVQPAFDVVNDPGDGKAVHSALLNVRALVRKIGAQAWCELYLMERPDFSRERERSGCGAGPDTCGFGPGLAPAFTTQDLPSAASPRLLPL